MIMYDV